MKVWDILTVAVASCWLTTARAQLQLSTNESVQRAFGGRTVEVRMDWHNASDKMIESKIQMRIFQISSATAVLSEQSPWKNLRVLPGQTVVESAPISFPAVKAETKFLVQWVENTNQILGTTEILVYPTNLLAELKPLAGGGMIGLFDPQNELKPLFKNLGVPAVDLESSGIENFSGRLALIGPFKSWTEMREDLPNHIEVATKKGVNVVWLLPARPDGKNISPSFYIVPEKTNSVVVVQPELVSDLAENPQSQLNLIYFCKRALNPQPQILPDWSNRKTNESL